MSAKWFAGDDVAWLPQGQFRTKQEAREEAKAIRANGGRARVIQASALYGYLRWHVYQRLNGGQKRRKL